MEKVIIEINGHYFKGVSYDDSYSSSLKGVGWYDSKGNDSDKILFTEVKEEAKVIEGMFNIRSCFNKILQFLRDHQIEINEINIKKI